MKQSSATSVSALHLLISSVLFAGLITLVTMAIHFQPIASANAVSPQTISTLKKTTPTKTHKTAKKTSQTPAISPITAPKSCIPANTPAQPEAISLETAPLGLSQVIDTPAYYQIFGNTSDQIRTQLQACAPLTSDEGQFVGETAYTMTWQYALHVTKDGVCEPRNVRVGLHTNMTLPSWSATDDATSGLSNKWKLFMNNLMLHENGHVALNKTHATKLLANLQTVTSTDCSTLKTNMQSIAKNALKSLDTANAAYDSHTNHGATQGAILP